MRKTILTIILFTVTLALGQNNEDPTELLISEFRSKMEKENIYNFFAVKHITYGTVYIFDSNDPNSCNANGIYFTMYAFWNDGKDSYVKKFDNCGGFNILKLSNSKPINFYHKNIEKIKQEEVQTYKIKPDRIENNKTYSYVSIQSHTPLRYFWFYQGSTAFEKAFDKHNLETNEENRNINYDYNKNLSLVKLNAICENIIDELEEKKKFKRL